MSSVDQIRKKWGIPSADEVEVLTDSSRTISTGSAMLDFMLHGGWGVGRMAELYGPEQAGKSLIGQTTTIEFIKNEQEKAEKDEDYEPEKVLFIDHENSFVRSWFEELGGKWEWIENDQIVLVNSLTEKAYSLERTMELIEDCVKSGEFGLIVVDSLDAMVAEDVQEELDSEMTAQIRDTKPRLMSLFCRKIVGPLAKNETTLLWINQVRSTQQTTARGYEITKPGGGKALNYYCAQIVSLKKDDYNVVATTKDLKGDVHNEFEETLAFNFNAKVEKNKIDTPIGNADVPILFWARECEIEDGHEHAGHHEAGFDNEHATGIIAVHEGLIERAGSWYSYTDLDGNEHKIQGKDKLIGILKEEGLMEEVKERAIGSSQERNNGEYDVHDHGFAEAEG